METKPWKIAMNKGRRIASEVEGGAPPAESLRGKRSSIGIGAVLVIVALAGGGWLLVQKVAADSKMQDCVMSGRKNCAPVDNAGR